MRVLKRNPWLTGLGTVLSLLGLWWGSARADATSDELASVLFFPKVIADGTRDTLIQITNSTSSQQTVHCEYINGTGRCSTSGNICAVNADCPATETCDPATGVTCHMSDFEFSLTRQQPFVWRASTGRQPNLLTDTFDPGECKAAGLSQQCPGATFFVQDAVAPTQFGFRGALICYTTDSGGAPMGTDAIHGEAILETLGQTQVSQYNAIGIISRTPTTPNAIVMDGVEYNACPESMTLTHYADGAADLVAGGASTVSTEITLVPCSIDFENANSTTATVQFEIFDEFENHFAAERSESTVISCWYNNTLGRIGSQFRFATLGTTFAKTRIRSAFGLRCTNDTTIHCVDDAACGGNGGEFGLCRPTSGLLAVAEEFHHTNDTASPRVGTDAVNLNFSSANRGRCLTPNTGFVTPSEPCTVATEGNATDDPDAPGCDTGATGDVCATDTIITLTPVP